MFVAYFYSHNYQPSKQAGAEFAQLFHDWELITMAGSFTNKVIGITVSSLARTGDTVCDVDKYKPWKSVQICTPLSQLRINVNTQPQVYIGICIEPWPCGESTDLYTCLCQ